MYVEPAHIVVYVQANVTSGSCIMGTQQIPGGILLIKNDL
jgi:hypothetical protein